MLYRLAMRLALLFSPFWHVLDGCCGRREARENGEKRGAKDECMLMLARASVSLCELERGECSQVRRGRLRVSFAEWHTKRKDSKLKLETPQRIAFRFFAVVVVGWPFPLSSCAAKHA